jgi:monofunctional biosynthetic peptidoglycan transglycosylase
MDIPHNKSINWIKKGKIVVGILLGWFFWFCMLLLMLRWVNPPFTSFMLQENWQAIQGRELYNLRDHWVPSNRLPDDLKLALVASEDQRFYQHWGIDFEAIHEAIKDNEQGHRVRGASTITQQVAKNLFLTPSKSYIRKGVEAGISLLIELFWTKDRILEVYLNIAEFGPGLYGIAEGTQYYYHKTPAQLTPKEAARMITVLPNPYRIEPVPASEYVKKRSHWILRNMQQLSGIRYLPKPKPDTTDTLSPKNTARDSLEAIAYQDSLSAYLDSMLKDIGVSDPKN